MNMAKPPRSPLLGYNHNVRYGGRLFHVQTEDSGPGNPRIFTHLFFEGSILASKRSDYPAETPEEEVRALMQSQHKTILRELKHGSYDDRVVRFFAARGQVFPVEEASPGVPAATPPPEALLPNPEAAAPSLPAPADGDVTEEVPGPSPESILPAVEPAPAAAAAVLDLDALPATPGEQGPTPEPLPVHLSRPAVPGPGTYTFRRATREQYSIPSTAAPPARPVPPTGSAPKPAVHPITPVVVQRQVVVGTGGPPATTTRKVSTTPVRRRPVSGGPYVVKEGSHANIPGSVRRVEQPRPLTGATDPAQAPRTAEQPRPPQPIPPQEGAPAAFVTDQSLDDVILAYLSQGEGKR
jgi:hypothetical protein